MTKALDKIKLIYEFNNNSPLFARVAESELKNGNIEQAITILENGFNNFPDYITARLIFVEALAKKGEYKKVIDIMEELRPQLDDDELINYYLEKIEEERANLEVEEDILHAERKSLEDDLENIADVISKAKIPPVDENKSNQNNEDFSSMGKQFISETLANIYFSQGNYNEALEIYQKLLEISPNKVEHLKEKIEETKKLMNK
ncbi:MAG TPA: tetratricopeptide repeat protein [Ignavibacteria bacterium]|nr:tetratricopeptide repeat protein [Ignavibacteria bacterium]